MWNSRLPATSVGVTSSSLLITVTQHLILMWFPNGSWKFYNVKKNVLHSRQHFLAFYYQEKKQTAQVCHQSWRLTQVFKTTNGQRNTWMNGFIRTPFHLTSESDDRQNVWQNILNNKLKEMNTKKRQTTCGTEISRATNHDFPTCYHNKRSLNS